MSVLSLLFLTSAKRMRKSWMLSRFHITWMTELRKQWLNWSELKRPNTLVSKIGLYDNFIRKKLWVKFENKILW